MGTSPRGLTVRAVAFWNPFGEGRGRHNVKNWNRRCRSRRLGPEALLGSTWGKGAKPETQREPSEVPGALDGERGRVVLDCSLPQGRDYLSWAHWLPGVRTKGLMKSL